MNYADALQLIGVTCLLAVPLGLLVGRFGGRLPGLFGQWLPPRYLRGHAVRRRRPVDAPKGKDHEPL